MRNLIWKQWRESRILLAIFTIWMILSVGYTVLYELGHGYRAVVGSFSSSAMLYNLVASIVLAVRTSQGEQTEGTLSFTTSLPISIYRVATVRIAAAASTLAIPLLIGAFLLAIALACGVVEQAEPRDAEYSGRLLQRPTAPLGMSLEQLSSVTAIAVFGGVELLFVISLCGCWLRSQAQVGLLGAVMALGSMIAEGAFWYGQRRPIAQLIYGVALPQSLMIQWGYGEATGDYTDHELAPFRWLSLALAVPVLAILASSFVYRYGSRSASIQTVKKRRSWIGLPTMVSRLPVRLPNRWIALIWLELRQSVPLALFGLVFAILVTVAGVFMESRHHQGFGTSFRMELPHSVFFIGMLWAVVVGSGLYSRDLDLKLGNFWRSRPISPAMWFWCKFIVGLVVVLVVLDGTTILVSWTAPRESMTSGMSWAYVGCFPLIHALMYSLAVLGTCAFRRPVIGGIVAVAGYFVATAAITAFPMTLNLEPLSIYNDLLSAERAGHVDFTQHGYPFVYGILAASIFVFALSASRLAKPLQPTFWWFARAPIRAENG
ncbi:hypothetical protein [Novipirellula artificiosorum]|uniref:ABC-2 family transporter protein n=1 Tax=Novipirellula artificiosorum TaxID=2528016 RepID=A0A5C6D1J8_9BACT|nr:hypothetical protein [Novipirellula artificiosorum]TWU28779.1 ABC-2 family transporter protein [Novipirellula artificiosorum]